MAIKEVIRGLNVVIVRLDRHGNSLGSLDLDGLGNDFLACATKLLQGVCGLLEVTFFALERGTIGTAVVSQVRGG